MPDLQSEMSKVLNVEREVNNAAMAAERETTPMRKGLKRSPKTTATYRRNMVAKAHTMIRKGEAINMTHAASKLGVHMASLSHWGTDVKRPFRSDGGARFPEKVYKERRVQKTVGNGFVKAADFPTFTFTEITKAYEKLGHSETEGLKFQVALLLQKGA